MMGPIKTPSVAPVRKIWHLVWDFSMEIRSCRYLWIRSHLRVIGILTKIFRTIPPSLRTHGGVKKKSANSKNIGEFQFAIMSWMCVFSEISSFEFSRLFSSAEPSRVPHFTRARDPTRGADE